MINDWEYVEMLCGEAEKYCREAADILEAALENVRGIKDDLE